VKIFLNYRERIAGLFIVITFALVVAFFVGAAIRNRWLAPRVSYHTYVVRGDGLRSGSPILLSGVEVGEVGDLTILEDDRVDVELIVLSRHARRIKTGTRASVRRLLGIGEKRVHLTSPGGGIVLRSGSFLPADEPMDLLDVVSQVDLGSYLSTLNRALATMELMLEKLEQNGRLDKLVAAFDRLGPTLEKVDGLLGDIHQPLVTLVKDPALSGTLRGADSVLNDPATKKALRNAARVLEPERIDRVLARVEPLLAKLEKLTAEDGSLVSTLGHADKLMTDGRVDKLITSLDKLTDEKKLGRIIDNVAILAEQTGKIGPEIPQITRELTATLREAVVVLRALQKTWLLEGKSDEARREMQPRPNK
jgi:ABC-type transporter Mla subunit MlaD